MTQRQSSARCALVAVLRVPREVVAGREALCHQCARGLYPDASEGAGSEVPSCFGLSGIKGLPGAGPAGGLECEKC